MFKKSVLWVVILTMLLSIIAVFPIAVSAQVDPVTWYKFDETSGTTAADSSGSGKNGTLNGGATWVAGKTGNAVNFSGSSQYMSMPAGIMSTLNDFSVATWVKLDVTGNWSRIFDIGTGTSVNMFLAPSAGGSAIRFAITTGGSGAEQRINGTAALPTGSWKHVAVTLSGSTGTLYVDGVQVGTNTSMTLKPSSLGNTTNNYIGRSEYSSDPYLDGMIDDFRIYDRALSAAEVQAMFTGGATPTPTPTSTPTLTPTPTPTSATTPTPTPTIPPVSNNWVVKPFNLNQVTLQSSTFTANRDRTYSYLLFLDNDRMLYNFRVTAGLSTNGAAALGGWDAPDCNLRGHSTGHYLSALAQAYASSGDSQYKTKLDYMITELGKCQDALPSKGYSAGFLAAYPETQFIQLESLATYPTIWAPYYTCHKIMAGLLDAYKLGGNTQALDIAKKMGDWIYGRLSKLTRTKLQQMWGLYIAGEFGGMNEVMAELYAITGNQNYLTTATYFDNDKLFTPCSNNQDQLSGMHANQHIPQTVGALRVYDQNNNSYYYNVASNFWNMVTGHHIYNIGGTGEGEMFKDADKIAAYIDDKDAETCATYNMLKLTRNLFFHNPDPKYMDYYERALYNDILASQNQASSHGFVTYFMPLGPGMSKTYTNDYSAFTCCHGTGMENHTKYQESVYFQSADASTLYVNLYTPSTLNWSAKGFTITQTTTYPTQEATSITVNGNGQLDIKLRVPSWVQNGYTVKINSVTQSITATPGTYITLSRVWTSGDKIDITMPFSLRLERTPDDSTVGSIFYGPILLVGKDTRTSYIPLTLNTSNLSQSITPTGTPLNFTTNGVTLVPMYSAYNFQYHAYFKIN